MALLRLPADPGPERQDRRFLLLYALAVAGGSVAYVPFLTILLPMRVGLLAGAQDISWLSYATFAGAIAASLGNIGFGWASDATRSRVPWIVGGLVLSTALLPLFALVETLGAIVALLVAWQLALNMMLAPVAAWAGDCIPDGQKGMLGGFLAFAPAAGALASVVVTIPGLADADARLWLVGALVVGFVAPVLLFGRPRAFPALAQDVPSEGPGQQTGPVVTMWLARLLVQISEAALFAFLYIWMRTIDPGMTDAMVARTFMVILVMSVPLALAAGAWADRRGRPFLPLIVTAAGAAAGLLVMAAAPGLAFAMGGYVIFGLNASVFLALHAAQTLRVLPRARSRGRDLGIFNLTNTCPSLVMPVLALALIPAFGFTGLFIALAASALSASLLLARMPHSA